MTEPQGMDPSAQIAPQHMITALQERVGNLTYENTMISAFNNQLIAQMKELEAQIEKSKSDAKETDGAEPQAGAPTPPEGPGEPRTNGHERGASPADLARRQRTRGGQPQ